MTTRSKKIGAIYITPCGKDGVWIGIIHGIKKKGSKPWLDMKTVSNNHLECTGGSPGAFNAGTLAQDPEEWV